MECIKYVSVYICPVFSMTWYIIIIITENADLAVKMSAGVCISGPAAAGSGFNQMVAV